MVVRLNIFCRNLFPRLIRISNIKRRHIPFLSRKGRECPCSLFHRLMEISGSNHHHHHRHHNHHHHHHHYRNDKAVRLPKPLACPPTEVYAMQCIQLFFSPRNGSTVLHTYKNYTLQNIKTIRYIAFISYTYHHDYKDCDNDN